MIELFKILILCVQICLCHSNYIFNVTTTYGVVIGDFYKNDDGVLYNKFIGIPYAKPPVGELRFKSPIPPDRWTYNRDAKTEPNVCVQSHGQSYTGNEDCLYLSVYTPSVPGSERHEKLQSPKYPVMVWFHGGNFESGSGNDGRLPDYLVRENVICVTVNYRLGVFGFLSVQSNEITGNMGIKDQLLALKWVNQNIEKFGGNKNQVTIFGTDAGAASIQYLLLTDQAKDLFQRAIMQSGSALNPWALQEDPVKRAKKFAEKLGKYNLNNQELKKINFKNYDTGTIYKASVDAVEDDDWGRKLSSIFVPVKEHFSSNDLLLESTVSSEMDDMDLRTNQIPKREVMIGFNSAEGLKLLNEELNFYSTWSYADHIENKLPRGVPITGTPKSSSSIYKKLSNGYNFNTGKETTQQKYVKLKGDAWYLYGIYQTALKLAEKSSKFDTYFYRFSFDGYGFSRHYLSQRYKNLTGANHGDEVDYLFKHKDNFFGKAVKPLPKTDTVQKVHKNMVTFWTNFAKTGNPTPENSGLGITWDKFTKSNQKYLDIGNNFQMKDIEEKSRMETWDEVYKEVGKLSGNDDYDD